jgi:hypothetical protein
MPSRDIIRARAKMSASVAMIDALEGLVSVGRTVAAGTTEKRMFLLHQHQIVSAPKYSCDTDSERDVSNERDVSKLGIYIAPEMPFPA